jgi:hypothetical protein
MQNGRITQHVIYFYGETPLVNYGPQSILLHILPSIASTVYFLQVLFIYLLQTNILFHMIHLILCFQQTSEINNLTASWDKVSARLLLAPVVRPAKSQLASTFRSGFFLLLVD